MTTRDAQALREALDAALDQLPEGDGGIVVVLATAGTPPAMAMLSSGDVWLRGDAVRVGLYGGSSAGRRLGGAFTLLVPDEDGRALRAEVVEAGARDVGCLVLLEGRLEDIRPTAEPPWVFDMRFRPADAAADSRDVDRFVAYWRGMREWLADPDGRTPPLT